MALNIERSQNGVVGTPANVTNSSGVTERALVPAVSLATSSGSDAGTSANPLVVSGSGSGTAFAAIDDATATIAATTTTARVALDSPPAGTFQVRIYNPGTTLAFIRFGTVAVNATATDIPIPPGILEVQSTSAAYVAAIMASGTATLYFTTGIGF